MCTWSSITTTLKAAGQPRRWWADGSSCARAAMTERSGTLVLGIGNVLMGDEGVGVHVIRHLEESWFPSNVMLLDGGTGSFTLLDPMRRAERILLVDATVD